MATTIKLISKAEAVAVTTNATGRVTTAYGTPVNPHFLKDEAKRATYYSETLGAKGRSVDAVSPETLYTKITQACDRKSIKELKEAFAMRANILKNDTELYKAMDAFLYADTAAGSLDKTSRVTTMHTSGMALYPKLSNVDIPVKLKKLHVVVDEDGHLNVFWDDVVHSLTWNSKELLRYSSFGIRKPDPAALLVCEASHYASYEEPIPLDERYISGKGTEKIMYESLVRNYKLHPRPKKGDARKMIGEFDAGFTEFLMATGLGKPQDVEVCLHDCLMNWILKHNKDARSGPFYGGFDTKTLESLGISKKGMTKIRDVEGFIAGGIVALWKYKGLPLSTNPDKQAFEIALLEGAIEITPVQAEIMRTSIIVPKDEPKLSAKSTTDVRIYGVFDPSDSAINGHIQDAISYQVPNVMLPNGWYGPGADYENGRQPEYLAQKVMKPGANFFVMGDDSTFVINNEKERESVILNDDTSKCDSSLQAGEAIGTTIAMYNMCSILNKSDNLLKVLLENTKNDIMGVIFVGSSAYSRDHMQISGNTNTTKHNSRIVVTRQWLSLKRAGFFSEKTGFTTKGNHDEYQRSMNAYAKMKRMTCARFSMDSEDYACDLLQAFDWISHSFGCVAINDANVITYSPGEYKLLGSLYAHRHKTDIDQSMLQKCVRNLGIALQFPELEPVFRAARWLGEIYLTALKSNFQSETNVRIFREEMISEFQDTSIEVIDEWIEFIITYGGVPERSLMLMYKYDRGTFATVSHTIQKPEAVLVTDPASKAWADIAEAEEYVTTSSAIDFDVDDILETYVSKPPQVINRQVTQTIEGHSGLEEFAKQPLTKATPTLPASDVKSAGDKIAKRKKKPKAKKASVPEVEVPLSIDIGDIVVAPNYVEPTTKPLPPRPPKPAVPPPQSTSVTLHPPSAALLSAPLPERLNSIEVLQFEYNRLKPHQRRQARGKELLAKIEALKKKGATTTDGAATTSGTSGSETHARRTRASGTPMVVLEWNKIMTPILIERMLTPRVKQALDVMRLAGHSKKDILNALTTMYSAADLAEVWRPVMHAYVDKMPKPKDGNVDKAIRNAPFYRELYNIFANAKKVGMLEPLLELGSNRLESRFPELSFSLFD